MSACLHMCESPPPLPGCDATEKTVRNNVFVFSLMINNNNKKSFFLKSSKVSGLLLGYYLVITDPVGFFLYQIISSKES